MSSVHLFWSQHLDTAILPALGGILVLILFARYFLNWLYAFFSTQAIFGATTQGTSVHEIVAAMNTHADNADIQEWGCSSLGSMIQAQKVNTPDRVLVQTSIEGAGGLVAILTAMINHSESEALQVSASQLVAALTTNHHTNQVPVVFEYCSFTNVVSRDRVCWRTCVVPVVPLTLHFSRHM
jgi:hypothetical protein